MAAEPAIIKLAAVYFLCGRSAAFCAYALARLVQVHGLR